MFALFLLLLLLFKSINSKKLNVCVVISLTFLFGNERRKKIIESKRIRFVNAKYLHEIEKTQYHTLYNNDGWNGFDSNALPAYLRAHIHTHTQRRAHAYIDAASHTLYYIHKIYRCSFKRHWRHCC